MAPDLETPGNIAASNWANPIKSAVWNVISLILFIFVLGFFVSTIKKIIPTIINASATDIGL